MRSQSTRPCRKCREMLPRDAFDANGWGNISLSLPCLPKPHRGPATLPHPHKHRPDGFGGTMELRWAAMRFRQARQR